MKVLLLGDFSGFHLNLKAGLTALGHEVTLASDGDSFKRLPSDIDVGSRYPGLRGKIIRNTRKLSAISRSAGYDVVQLINPFFMSRYFPLQQQIYEGIKKKNRVFSLVAGGFDAYYWRYAKKHMKYTPLDDFKKFDLKKDQYFMETRRAFKLNEAIVHLADVIIPTIYDYEVCYQGVTDKVTPFVNLPIDTSKVDHCPATFSGPIRILHGITRYGHKGSRYIIEALKIIERSFTDEVKIEVVERLPYEKFMDKLRNTDILIDQANTYGAGMNALLAMAMGKVVMSGNELWSETNTNDLRSPCVNIRPDVPYIVEQITYLLEDRFTLMNLASRGRHYTSENHDCVKIAASYINHWESVVLN